MKSQNSGTGPESGDLPHGECPFGALGLSARALAAVRRAGFVEPTAIQCEFIPAALTGRDCIGRAKTGTGKTAAFLLPIFEHFFRREAIHALILAPTRELARQICEESSRLAGAHPPTSLAVYGGQPMRRQIEHLRQNPEIVVATPGRIIDHYKRRNIAFHRFGIVVLDEVDRMFDLGFREDIAYILGHCTNRQQTLLLSATIPDSIERLIQRYTRDAVRVSTVDADNPSVETLDQRYFSIAANRKSELLVRVLERERPELCLVFTRTKHGADRVAAYLTKAGVKSAAIHGDLQQNRREKVLEQFRRRAVPVLVATDVMGRGIDVPGVTHVINYDIPENPEDYLHRVGRSGRMNTPGTAMTFITPEQGKEMTEIEILCNRMLAADSISDFDTGLKKRGR